MVSPPSSRLDTKFGYRGVGNDPVRPYRDRRSRKFPANIVAARGGNTEKLRESQSVPKHLNLKRNLRLNSLSSRTSHSRCRGNGGQDTL